MEEFLALADSFEEWADSRMAAVKAGKASAYIAKAEAAVARMCAKDVRRVALRRLFTENPSKPAVDALSRRE